MQLLYNWQAGSQSTPQGAMKSRLVLVTAPAVVVMGATLKKSRHSARPLSKVSSGAPAAVASSSSSSAPESALHVVGVALG